MLYCVAYVLVQVSQLLMFFVCTCAGFTAVDVLGHGVMGHLIGTGTILSLRVCSTPLVSAHMTILLAVEWCLFPAGAWKDLI